MLSDSYVSVWERTDLSARGKPQPQIQILAADESAIVSANTDGRLSLEQRRGVGKWRPAGGHMGDKGLMLRWISIVTDALSATIDQGTAAPKQHNGWIPFNKRYLSGKAIRQSVVIGIKSGNPASSRNIHTYVEGISQLRIALRNHDNPAIAGCKLIDDVQR